MFTSTSYILLAISLVGFNFILCNNRFAEAQSNISEMDKEAIEKLREFVKNELYKDYMKSDAYLIRWLRATEFDQNSARERLIETMKWRKENKIDTITQEKGLDSLGKAFFAEGTDNEGSLIATILASRWDTRGQIVAGKQKELLRELPRLCEVIEQDILKRVGVIGNNVTTGRNDVLTLIIDLQGYNIRQHACLTC